MSDDDLSAGMQQIVKGLASDPSQRSPPRDHSREAVWYHDDSDQPMTKREARQIIEAIKGIRTYDGAQTNEHLAVIKAQLGEIKWYMGWLAVIALIIMFKLVG